MKLISLKVKAFGPFRNQEIIEFNKLGEDPLFLIDGPTGAGKSSILNAISFALYGDLADKDRNNEGLRCDFSDDDIETLVTLKFQLRGVIYQITRSPTQVVRKKVGEGFRERPGEAELLKMGENEFEVLVPRKMKEATERIEQIVGLDKNQFTQVMVLPQGKFRELLLASSDERQKILSTLFGTKRFKEIELLLKEKSKEIIKKYEHYKSKVDSVLKSFDLKYNEVDKLDELIQDEIKNLKISKEEKDKAQKKREESSNKLEIANNILKTFYLLDQKREEFSNSLEKKKKNELIKEKIFEAEEARKIKISFNRYSDCEKKILSVQKDISFIKIERNKSKQKLEAANSNFLKAEALLKKKDAFIAKGVELNSFFEKSTALENTFLKYKEIKKSLEIEEVNYLKLRKEKKKNSEELKDIENEVNSITNTLSQKAELVKKENDLQGKLTKKRELNDLEDIKNKKKQSLSLLEENFSKINEGLIKAQEEADLLEMNWHSNQASLLAKKLKRGEPCPVCGSEDHPRPSISKTELVDKEVVEEARKKERNLINEKNKAAVGIGKIKTLIERVQEREELIKKELGSDYKEEIPFLEQKLDSIKCTLNEVEQKGLRLKKIIEKKENLNRIYNENERLISNLNDNVLPRLKEESVKWKYNLDSIKKLLPEKYYNLIALKADIEKNKRLISEIQFQYDKSKREQEIASKNFTAICENLKLREKDHKVSEEELELASLDWSTEFEKSPFKKKEDFLKASENILNLDLWREEIQSFEKSLNTLKGEKESLEKQLSGKHRPKVSELEENYRQSIHWFNQKETLWVKIEGKKKKLEEAKNIVFDLQKTIKEIEDKSELVGTLADMASGKLGLSKISLERFVLMDLLDRVLQVASERLYKMSKGQYRLIRLDGQKQNKVVSAGLDLAVDDFYTGKQRPVKTLSGGESFLASLSLALALSDIVQRRSGGIQIETLFIDEGFGSLDPESLQLAIDTLKDLHTSGRSIGIISHVTELKDQIPLRIDVKNSRRGSEISLSI